MVLECGGKNPAVVLDDVKTWTLSPSEFVNGSFWNMGENCSATSPAFVHAKVKDDLPQRIGAYMREWNMATRSIGKPHRRTRQHRRISRRLHPSLDDAKKEKLSVVHGGDTRDGIFVEPTVVDGVAPSSRLFQEEIFRPVLSVTTFKSTSRGGQACQRHELWQADGVRLHREPRNAIKLSRDDPRRAS